MKPRAGIFFILITGVLIAFSSCEPNPGPQINENAIPEQGQTPLPLLSASDYQALRSIQPAEGRSKSTTSGPINIELLEPLLIQAQEQTGSQYAGIISVRDSSGIWYSYNTMELSFSEEAIEKADGKLQPFFLEISKSENNSDILQVAAAYIPDSRIAFIEMAQWLTPKTELTPVIKNKQEKAKSSGEQVCIIDEYISGGNTYYEISFCQIEMTITNGGSGYDYPTPGYDGWEVIEWPDTNTGSGCPGGCLPDGGSAVIFCDSGDINSCLLDEERIQIKVDNTITRNDLTNCVYNKLNNSQLFRTIIENFEGNDSTFDLLFKLAETDDNAFGHLDGVPPNTFRVTIDASWVSIRNDVEVASTFLHEVMHAEMRRYLYEQKQNGSSIPGFPGSFTDDWNNYVKQKTGGVGAAEHEVMAEFFIAFLADGLEEFDNKQLDRNHYEALAWDGLLQTDAWKNANQNQIGQYRHDEAIDNRPIKCER